jgi:hypothetical protein
LDDLKTLPRDAIAKLIPCKVDHLEIILSPFSTLFETDYLIACAFNAGRPMARPSAKASIPMHSTSGELCNHAVNMTCSLVHSFGSQIHGNAIFFYFKPKKDFLAATDFKATQDFTSAWNLEEYDCSCSQETLEKLPKVFKKSLSELSAKSEEKVEFFDTLIIPALEGKPFIAKSPFFSLEAR